MHDGAELGFTLLFSLCSNRNSNKLCPFKVDLDILFPPNEIQNARLDLQDGPSKEGDFGYLIPCSS